MSRTITIEEKSVEEALAEASRRLGREPLEGEYAVVENRKGFWGMSRKVILELRVPDEWQDPGAAPDPDSDGKEAQRSAPDRGFPESESARVGWQETPTSDQSATIVRGWVAEMVQAIGLELAMTVSSAPEGVRVELSGADERRLAANHGELLAAIQFLVGKLGGRRFGTGVRIEVDAGGFRDRRARELAELARKTAEAVRKNGKRALLPPMGPGERRQIHLTLSEDPEVTTESEGEGFKKRVAVFLRTPRA